MNVIPMGRFRFASPSLSNPSSATWPRRTVTCVRARNSSYERTSVPILRLSLRMNDRKMLTRASKGMANGMLLSTPSRGDRNAMDRFEAGRERTGGTNCSSSPLSHQSIRNQKNKTSDSKQQQRKRFLTRRPRRKSQCRCVHSPANGRPV